MLAISDTQKIGVGLTGFGATFLLLGVLLFFDKGLLAMGNVFFLAGIAMLIGLQKTMVFFFQKRKLRGTACFLGGIFLVLMGWPFIGMCVEAFGFINLFGDFFPVVISFLRRLPFVGTFLNLPGVSSVIDKIAGAEPLP
eukprot:Nk52_evm1s647 gene=Nk52_evmTU1s647